MHIGMTWHNKDKGKKGKHEGKNNTTRAKTTAARGTTITTTATKEKGVSTINRLDKEIHSKDTMDLAKEKDTAITEKEQDTTTINVEAKEQNTHLPGPTEVTSELPTTKGPRICHFFTGAAAAHDRSSAFISV